MLAKCTAVRLQSPSSLVNPLAVQSLVLSLLSPSSSQISLRRRKQHAYGRLQQTSQQSSLYMYVEGMSVLHSDDVVCVRSQLPLLLVCLCVSTSPSCCCQCLGTRPYFIFTVLARLLFTLLFKTMPCRASMV